MSALFLRVLRQAFKTFDRTDQVMFDANLTQLKQLADQLTYHDMHLNDRELFSEAAFTQLDRAPCAFVPIFEDDVVSMSVFVMRPGYTMPLHDHPMMHGILRGIYGKLSVKSYTQRFAPNEPFVYDSTKKEIQAIAEEPLVISPETECAVLTPRERNFHEITALDGVVAFFDILSPSYDAVIPDYGSRRCRFYSVAAQSLPLNEVCLQRIPAPMSYYCDTVDTPETVSAAIYLYSEEECGKTLRKK